MDQHTTSHAQDESPSDVRRDNQQEYNSWLYRIDARYRLNTRYEAEPLFTVNLSSIWELYLTSLPLVEVQYHTCHACRHFLQRYGSLVTIHKETGEQMPLLWDVAEAPLLYRQFVEQVSPILKRKPITGVFYPTLQQWGTPETPPWTHFAVRAVRPGHIYHHPLLTAGQRSAQKAEDYKTVRLALQEFSLPLLQKAVALLETRTFFRAEKVLPQARWLRALQHRLNETPPGRLRHNLLWRAIALAPEGFCHPRASVLGFLLDTLQAGVSPRELIDRVNAKMGPLYQRPQAPPKAGNIDVAEQVFERLGLAPALKRRFATMADVTPHLVWKPTLLEKAPGLFGHLRKEETGADPGFIPAPHPYTWVKFREQILPEVLYMSVMLPYSTSLPFAGFVTASDPSAPPIVQWDCPEARNTVSWYLHDHTKDHLLCTPEHWSLQSGASYQVTGVCLQPNMWQGEEMFLHQGKGVLFIIAGAADRSQVSLCLFPEILKAELRAVRSTIEAHSKSATIDLTDDPPVCGLLLQSGNTYPSNLFFEIATKHYRSRVQIERWD